MFAFRRLPLSPARRDRERPSALLRSVDWPVKQEPRSSRPRQSALDLSRECKGKQNKMALTKCVWI